VQFEFFESNKIIARCQQISFDLCSEKKQGLKPGCRIFSA
jgi:hypothetical protein